MADQEYPEPTVGAIILNSKGEMLLVKSHKWHNKYVIPGGHIELGETMEQALKREILEETGLKISGIEYIGHQEFIYDEAFWKKRHFIFFDFCCRSESENARLNSEGQEYVWVNPEKVMGMDVEPYTKSAIKAYLNKKK